VKKLIGLRKKLSKMWSKMWNISTVYSHDNRVFLMVSATHFFLSDVKDIENTLEDVLEKFEVHIIAYGDQATLIIESSELVRGYPRT